jgi:hypothetical protein
MTTIPPPLPASAATAANAATLAREIAWFGQVLEERFRHYFEQPGTPFVMAPAPELAPGTPGYAATVCELGLSAEERIVVILALMPSIRPQALDLFFTHNKAIDRRFSEFGGWRGKTHEGFLPTCETAAFILAGDDLARRFDVLALFDDRHVFARQRVLRCEPAGAGEPAFGAMLALSADYLQRLTTGVCHKPDYTSSFPARLITTQLDWGDLVLAPEVRYEVETIGLWLRQSDTLLRDWGLARSVKPGYRCLFYGPPGTGKTLTAMLIGASAGADVYRIDLSMVVSKYIGETEKNLANVFDQAEDKHWILFFDEADALFGKRTDGTSSNDRHANQEISYLLQRVEDFPGVVILASNLRANIDEAFARRFQGAVYFPMPDAAQRLQLWRGMFPDPARLAPGVDLAALADKFELAGGAITNAVRYAAIRATRAGRTAVLQQDLQQGAAKEMIKEGRTF